MRALRLGRVYSRDVLSASQDFSASPIRSFFTKGAFARSPL